MDENKELIIGGMLFLMAGVALFANKAKKRKSKVAKIGPINQCRKTHSQYHFLVKLMQKKDEGQKMKISTSTNLKTNWQTMETIQTNKPTR